MKNKYVLLKFGNIRIFYIKIIFRQTNQTFLLRYNIIQEHFFTSFRIFPHPPSNNHLISSSNEKLTKKQWYTTLYYRSWIKINITHEKPQNIKLFIIITPIQFLIKNLLEFLIENIFLSISKHRFAIWQFKNCKIT